MRDILIFCCLAFLLFGCSKDSANKPILVKAERSTFESNVITTGELKAKNSTDILGPASLRRAGIWQVQISDLVPEGTIVKKGDYVGKLDPTELTSKLKENQSELDKLEAQYTQTKLDTMLDLRLDRDNLINLKYTLEEKEVVLSQSKYEPPAVQRQAEIDVEKARRALSQSTENNELKVRQAEAKMKEITATLTIQKNKIKTKVDLIKEFTIKSPEPGMLIYKRSWSGKKQGVGTNISPWNLTVATLPDLTEMVSVSYVNEVDISKVKTGQTVKIGIDAFPDKKFNGTISKVANIGEQRPNSDAKVFEVIVLLHENDTMLRPAMTTSNAIAATTIDSVISLPNESVFKNDSMSFVYKFENGEIVLQEVAIAQKNNIEALIVAGIEEEEEVYLSTPTDSKDAKTVRLTKQQNEQAQSTKDRIVKRQGEIIKLNQEKLKALEKVDSNDVKLTAIKNM